MPFKCKVYFSILLHHEQDPKNREELFLAYPSGSRSTVSDYGGALSFVSQAGRQQWAYQPRCACPLAQPFLPPLPYIEWGLLCARCHAKLWGNHRTMQDTVLSWHVAGGSCWSQQASDENLDLAEL